MKRGGGGRRRRRARRVEWAYLRVNWWTLTIVLTQSGVCKIHQMSASSIVTFIFLRQLLCTPFLVENEKGHIFACVSGRDVRYTGSARGNTHAQMHTEVADEGEREERATDIKREGERASNGSNWYLLLNRVLDQLIATQRPNLGCLTCCERQVNTNNMLSLSHTHTHTCNSHTLPFILFCSFFFLPPREPTVVIVNPCH